MWGIRLPFDPKVVYGRTRAPLIAQIGGRHYRTITVPLEEGLDWLPIDASIRQAAGLKLGDRVEVVLELEPTTGSGSAPLDLSAAIAAEPRARAAWGELDSNRRDSFMRWIEQAPTWEEHNDRIAATVARLRRARRSSAR